MVELSRTVRLCVNASGSADERLARDNTYSAWPPIRGLGRYYELTVTCRGEPAEPSGYLINIKRIDEAIRDEALGVLREAVAAEDAARGGSRADDGTVTPMGELMRRLLRAVVPALPVTATSLTLALTPRVHLTLEADDMDHVTLRQQYEFSAAHRLHVPTLSDAQNREMFGKCNNPAGHGHNYRLEVAVRVPIAPNGHVLAVETLDAVVNEHAVEVLDHKHLNEDVPQFAGLNPSVEHIARVIWGMLERPIASLAGGGVRLEELRVWETDKTVCTYRGPADQSD